MPPVCTPAAVVLESTCLAPHALTVPEPACKGARVARAIGIGARALAVRPKQRIEITLVLATRSVPKDGVRDGGAVIRPLTLDGVAALVETKHAVAAASPALEAARIRGAAPTERPPASRGDPATWPGGEHEHAATLRHPRMPLALVAAAMRILGAPFALSHAVRPVAAVEQLCSGRVLSRLGVRHRRRPLRLVLFLFLALVLVLVLVVLGLSNRSRCLVRRTSRRHRRGRGAQLTRAVVGTVRPHAAVHAAVCAPSHAVAARHPRTEASRVHGAVVGVVRVQGHAHAAQLTSLEAA